MGGMMAGMGLWMLLWALIAVAVLVLAVLGIVALVRHLSTPTRPGDESDSRRGTPSRPSP